MESNDTHVLLDAVSKSFSIPGGEVQVLRNASARIHTGERVAIVGPSGSGKSTLLALIAGLDTPTTGEVFVGGRPLTSLKERALATYRNTEVGIIFQAFELITPFTVRENVQAPLDIGGSDNEERVQSLITQVGLTHRMHAYPRTLSGGEKQRVAIARALANSPSLVLADEPTGSLDRVTGAGVFDLLLEEIAREKTTLIMITHDRTLAARMDRVVELKDGVLYESV